MVFDYFESMCVMYIYYMYIICKYIYICIDRFLVDNPGDVHMLADACLLPQLPLLPFKHLLLSLSAFAT